MIKNRIRFLNHAAETENELPQLMMRREALEIR